MCLRRLIDSLQELNGRVLSMGEVKLIGHMGHDQLLGRSKLSVGLQMLLVAL